MSATATATTSTRVAPPATGLDFTHSDRRNARRYAEAKEILSLAVSLLGRPESVVDVGGGQGAWCRAWQDLGVPAVNCIDHPGALAGELMIPREIFIACDLSSEMPPVVPSDWAMCFEVAEHLPENRSRNLVEYLTQCADTVLFSAAIPGQPGDHHINCQPPSFWRECFSEFGFRRIDCLRGRLVGRDLSYWWKQNLFVFTRRDDVDAESGFPSQHADDVVLVSDKMYSIYLEALRVSKVPLTTRIFDAIRSKLPF